MTLTDDTARADGPSGVIPILFDPKILPGYRGWQLYTVQPGDTLSGIARDQCGNADFDPIFQTNQNSLSDPNLIFPGQVLRIPRNDI